MINNPMPIQQVLTPQEILDLDKLLVEFGKEEDEEYNKLVSLGGRVKKYSQYRKRHPRKRTQKYKQYMKKLFK